ncbi:MAG: hypothetical protein KC983_02490, partial [Phycisphaerales bacterium]|nr:hypothetical protein [Phycisphaerales bacterium]
MPKKRIRLIAATITCAATAALSFVPGHAAESTVGAGCPLVLNNLSGFAFGPDACTESNFSIVAVQTFTASTNRVCDASVRTYTVPGSPEFAGSDYIASYEIELLGAPFDGSNVLATGSATYNYSGSGNVGELFAFWPEPAAVTPGQTYALRISFTSCESGSVGRIIYIQVQQYAGGELTINGSPQSTDLGFRIFGFDAVVPCPADCAPDNGDGTFGNDIVNIDDLLAVINGFGEAGGPCDNAPDNGDGTFGNSIVNIDDLLG